MSIKGSIFWLLRQTHLAVASRALPNRLAIYFHDLPEAHWRDFKLAMRHLRTLGYRFVSAAEFVVSPPEARVVWISFDDNHAVWHRALGMLAETGVTATFFVNSGPLEPSATQADIGAYYDRICHHGDRTPLSAEMVREMVAAGHNIGCHTTWHRALTSLPRCQWHEEIARSKGHLEDILGTPVTEFAFPYGMRRFFDARLGAYCRELGFDRIATGIPGYQHQTAIDPTFIHRTRWLFENSLERNLDDLRIDGRTFERLTGRSAVG